MPSTGRILYVLGLLFMLLCIMDAAFLRFAKIDLTGYQFTSVILGGIGIVLINVARFMPTRAVDEREDE